MTSMKLAGLLVVVALTAACSSEKPVETTARVSQALSASGLVAAYGFNEGTGTKFRDVSGAGNDGTVSGASWSTSGKYGGALSFDGSDDWASVPHWEAMHLWDGVTLEAWVRPTSLGTNATVIAKEDAADGTVALLASRDGEPATTVEESDVTAASALALNVWSHVASTFDGETANLYVNGDLVASDETDGFWDDGYPLRIGGMQNTTAWFHGLVDEVRVYRRALTELEIEGDMATALGGPPAGPVLAFGFDEGSGTSAGDTSGHSNSGVISGASWTTSGRFGAALSFDGVDDWVTVADAASLDLTTGLTIEAWVRPDSLPAQWVSLLAKEDTSNVSYSIYTNDDYDFGGIWVGSADPGPTQVARASRPPLGEWTYLAVTFDGSELRYYLDGVLLATTPHTESLIPSSGPLHIGGNAIWGEWFDGLVDEVRVYNRALSPREIGRDMVTPVVQAVPGAALVAAYGFEEASGATTADASGNANSGTLDGATWTTAGKFGNSVAFDGDEARVVVADAPELRLQNHMTLMAWVNPTSLEGDWRTVILKEFEADVSFGLYANDLGPTPPAFYARAGYGAERSAGVAALPTNAWSHLAATYDNDVLALYVDGVLVGATHTTGTIAFDGGDLSIGGNAIWGEWFEGKIDEVQLFDRALSESAIRAAMTVPVGGGSGCASGCDDGNACNGLETCSGSTCVAGTPPTVDDGNPCTVDACSPTLGVTHAPATSGTSCADATVCNGAETCNGSGTCAPGTPPAIDDANPCTTDSCDPVTGVAHAAVSAGTSCSDLDACNGAEICSASAVCQPGTPINTEDGNPCTAGSCNVATGEVTQAPMPSGTECTPDACSEGECNPAGECVVTSTSVQNDNNPCTLEWCDPDLGPQQKSCPALNAGVATTLWNSTEWLYTGANPVQTGVAPGTIVAERASALKGSVTTRALAPVSGATVTVVGHPEFGETLTQADGSFILVVNGGDDLVVEVTRDGFLTTQRRIQARWQEFGTADPIVLIPADPIVTAIELDSNAPFQVARSTEQVDADGAREGVLLVPGATTATMHFANGSTAPLPQMSVRITEFTVGATGRDAMPGPLPPESQYTYAFEVNADEAVAQGAHEVTFSQPLIHYVDNFLAFPAGTNVPVGSYDRIKTAWETEENGIVLDIVSETAGMADLDITGDGIADTTFGTLGITSAERTQMAALYAPGQSLWRVRLNHFTQPWDYNWGAFPPEDAVPPSAGPATGPPPCTDTCCGPVVAGAGPGAAPNDVSGASVIGCREQLLRETIPIAGTPYSLHYSSNRVPGRRADYQVEIPLTNATPPASLIRVDLTIDVAGRKFKTSHVPAPNLMVPFEWDGIDAFGRVVQGEQALRATVTYVYPVTYAPTSSFAAFGSGAPLTGNAARSELYSSRTFDLSVGAYNAHAQGLGGWTLSAVNNYDPVVRSLQFGTGSRRDQDSLPPVVVMVAGPRNGQATPVDGGPALAAKLAPYSTAIDAQGRAYVSRETPGELWRVNRNATLTRLAPSVNWGRIEGMDVGPDGSLYVAIKDQHVVKRFTPGGVVETVAGTGVAGFSGDGGLATLAMLDAPNDVTVARDGSVYINDQLNDRLRRVFPDGTIRTVAGIGHLPSNTETPAPGTPALSHHFHLGRIAAAPDGSVYATAQVGFATWYSLVFRFDPDGTVTRVAGGDCTSCDYEHGQPPLLTNFWGLGDIDVDDAGIVYAHDHVRLVAIYPHVVETIMGCPGSNCSSAILNVPPPDGSPARQHMLAYVKSVNAGPDGIYFTSGVALQGWSHVFRVQSPLPAGAGASMVIGSSTGEEFFDFDANGRHVATRHALTGSNLLTVAYDGSSRLSEVRNEVNLATTIERSVNGTATAIIGPFGQRTELEIGPDGYLASVEHPTGETLSMTYHPGGLLATFTNGRGGVSEMTYDAAGRLQLDEDAADGSHTLVRSGDNRSFSVDRTTALGRTTTYDTDVLDDGQLILSTTHPDGTVHTSSTVNDGAFEFEAPDGTTATQVETAEARFGLAAPLVSRTTVLPSGLTNSVTTSRIYTNLNPGNLLDFTSFNHSQVAGTSFLGSTTYTRSTRTFSHLSGASRSSTRIIDTLGRTTRTQTNGIAAVDYFYDTSGRLDRTVQSTRTTQYAYFASGPAAGYLESVTDPSGVATVYTRDAAGRPLTQTRAGATTTFTWDDNGNLASVTPPGKPVHAMTHTPVNLLESYQPPGAGLPLASTAYTYDADRMLRTETRPTSQQIVRTPDAFGRLDTVTFPGGALDYDYVASNATSGAGKTSAISGPYGVDLGFTYDGFLNTGITWSGDVIGSVGWQYNNRFAKTSETVTGAFGTGTTAFGYDNELLVTCASPTTCSPAGSDALVLTRSFQHGMVTNLALGNTSEAFTYNTFGELATQNAQYSGSPLVNITYHATGAQRDALGRIVQKTEVIGGVSKVFTYEYDNLGRLEDVFINGVLDEHFGYDLNGNRTTHFSAATGLTVTPTYDDQDRLLTYGTWTFTYTANGELETKTNTATGDEWIYGYDVLGNLLTVGLPEGDLVEYLVDGEGRRVGKIFNGTLISQWIYRDALKPVAELNGSGALIAQYAYGSRSTIPDYVRRGGNTYRVVSDHLGSPRYVVNVANSADVPFVANYTAFGSVTGTGLDWMPFGFAGGIYDPETQLVRFGARDYDSSTGRWTAKDRIRFDSGDGNVYVYAANDPINRVDVNGEFWQLPFCMYYQWLYSELLEDCTCEVRDACSGDGIFTPQCQSLSGGYFTTAVWNCVHRKDPEAGAKLIAWCGAVASTSIKSRTGGQPIYKKDK